MGHAPLETPIFGPSRAVALDEPARPRSGPCQAAAGGSIPCLASLMGGAAAGDREERQRLCNGAGEVLTVAAEGARPQVSSDRRGGWRGLSLNLVVRPVPLWRRNR